MFRKKRTETKETARRAFLYSGSRRRALRDPLKRRPAPAVSIEIFRGGFIVGVNGGRGSLRLSGRRYPLQIGGVGADATIGAASLRLYGAASRLPSLRDIEGVYSAMIAGPSVIHGPSAVDLINQRGVVLRLRGSQVGVTVSLDLVGMRYRARRPDGFTGPRDSILSSPPRRL